MAIYNGPARGGTRGGKDLFDWEDVKEDKYNQNYLGHSVKAPVGRWQKNKDLDWYRKKSKFDLAAAQKAELEIAKEREKDLMAQMLGEKPMEAPKSDMTRIEKNKLYKRGNAEEGTVAAEIEADSFGERVEGLGYAPIKIDNLREQMDTTTHERQEGTAVNDLLKAHAEGHGDAGERHQHAGEEDQDHAALLAAIEAAGAFSPKNAQADPSDKKAMKKRLKKLEKEEKKRKKAEKKAAKRSKSDKEKSTRPRDDSDSRSSSEGRGREPSPAGREERRGGLEKGERGAGSRREEERRTELRRRSRSRSRSRDRDQRRDRDRSRSRSRGRERDRSRSGEERRHR